MSTPASKKHTSGDALRANELDIASLLIHADTLGKDEIPVGVPISVSTTFRHPVPSSDDPAGSAEGQLSDFPPPADSERHIYSRESQPNLTRVEKVLSAFLKGKALAWSSGLSAVFAAFLLYQPEVIAIEEGYHGTHGAISVYKQTRPDVKVIGIDDNYSVYTGKRLLCWLETPVNPKGICRDMEKFVKKTRAIPNAKIAVDATFGPPPLQDPFAWGVDMVMHSGTKYFAGHSDALVGVLAVQKEDEYTKLWEIRTYTGMCPGSLETWLLLRSLRTLTLRVQRQSSTGTALAVWLNQVATNAVNVGESYDGCPGGVIKKVWHAALQGLDGATGDGFNPLGGSATGDQAHVQKAQMTGGPACFAFLTSEKEQAKWLPNYMNLMVHATSLGGVESLIEHRILSDAGADPCLIRLSIGLEELDDLKEDFRRSIKRVLEEQSGSGRSKL